MADPDKVIEVVRDLAAKDPDIAQMLADVRNLDHLQQDAGWQTLFRRITEQKATFMLGIARGLMAGKFPDKEELAYRRGYFQGALDTVSAPATAAESLERAALAAYRKALREEAEGSDQPYT